MINKKIKRRRNGINLQILNLVLLIAVLSFASILIFKVKTIEKPTEEQSFSSVSA